MPTFKESKCAIPSLWCGKGPVPKNIRNDKKYTRKGTSVECMKQGFGAGMMSEKSKHLPPASLQQIKYIGETHEKNFKKAKIETINKLIKTFKSKEPEQIKLLLSGILMKKNSTLDKKAYNSVLLFLYRHGNSNIPSCFSL